MSVLVFLTMRVLHVVLAAAWFGAVAFTTLYLAPAVSQLGPAGAPVLGELVRRGVPKYLASIGGLTILTGVYLFWHFTSGFDPVVSASRAGMAYSIGALSGIVALMFGGIMVSRSVKRMAELGPKIASLPEGPERAALVATMSGLRERAETFSRVVLALLLISLATMALGHYI